MNLDLLELLFQAIAIIAAFVAAWLWYRSTQVLVPGSLGVVTVDMDYEHGDETPEKRWANEVSEKNRRAALATAVSVAAQGVALIISMFR